MLSPGDPAPPLDATDQDGQTIRLEDLWRGGGLVLFFYPADFTPVCTQEACLFRDAAGDLAARGVQVAGVSADDAASHRRFRDAHALPYPLLSDPDRRLARAFGVVRPLGFLGTRRATFVIGGDGRVRGVFHHELRADRHLADVRALLHADAEHHRSK